MAGNFYSYSILFGLTASAVIFTCTLLLSPRTSPKDDGVDELKGSLNDIIDHIIYGEGKHESYDRMASFVDKFESRETGTENLEKAIDFMLEELSEEGLDNVHGESVQVPHWIRGEESLAMLLPRRKTLALLGLGTSIGTPANGITAKILVVRSFEELHDRAEEAKGKIVVYNVPYMGYGATVQYRKRGAVEAAKVGGVASLIRSVTPFSIYSPHTGAQTYQEGVDKIPSACITIEDAELLQRIFDRGQQVVLKLQMAAENREQKMSRNTIAEITGYKYPEQVVIVSGHMDSWDVGQGAMDDMGGAMIAREVLTVVKRLGLRPKRTIRLVMWTGEEQGVYGGLEYFKRHKGNISNFSLVMESDEGTFQPNGIDFAGSKQARRIIKRIATVLKRLKVTEMGSSFGGPDVDVWTEHGVPGVSLSFDKETKDRYFTFHHSDGDTVTVQDADSMDVCAAVFSVIAYAVASLDEILPR